MDESDVKMEEVDKDVKIDTENNDIEGEGSSSKAPALRRSKRHPKSDVSPKAVTDPEGQSKVIKISHLPFGFFEEELFKYFRQFGSVRRVRVPRSRKTGNFKGFAFVQFTNEDVAQVAAETMHGYVMFEKRLLCRVLKNKELPRCILSGKTIRQKPIRGTGARKNSRLQNRQKSDKAVNDSKKRLLKRLEKTKQQLAKMGFDYSIEPTEFVKPKKRVVEGTKKEELKEESLIGNNDDGEVTVVDVEEKLDNDEEIVRKVKKPRKETITEEEKIPTKVGTSKRERENITESEEVSKKLKKSEGETEITVKKAKISKKLQKSVEETPAANEDVPKKLKKSVEETPAANEDVPKKLKKSVEETVKTKKVAKKLVKRKKESVPKKAKIPKKRKNSTKQPIRTGKVFKKNKISVKNAK